ncbi:hypothetical protein [Diaphorobacter nitroreducens]|uniref:hypothetical protein n=1 Tax=Diaphorobacter nitroreducens TaxID=164759 RepID=UPI0028AD3C88|nr:hypothetical protein [Diaphorobacter nitroreducens]
MMYFSGSPILLGDRVGLGGGVTGIVVAVIDSGLYSEDYPEREWAYLNSGVLIETAEAGLIHRPVAGDDFDLLERGQL